MMLLRHLLSILLLPFIVVVVVRWRILCSAGMPSPRPVVARPRRVGGMLSRVQPSLLRVLGGAGLEQRFGQGYLAYKAHVPRWIPRPRPWSGA